MRKLERRRLSRRGISPGKLLMAACLLSTVGACSKPEPGTGGGGASTAVERRGEHDEHEEPGKHGDHREGVVELSPEAAARARIRTALVEERVLAAQLHTTGQVDFDQDRLAHVSPRVTGRVHRVNASLGEEVRAGQALAEIDSIELGQAKAAYLQAQADEELARTSFGRVEALAVELIVSEQQRLEAEAHFKEASAGLRTAEETLRLYGLSEEQMAELGSGGQAASIYPLKAPFAGTIVDRHVTLGELVTPERNLFTLADLSRVWIWIDVYQRDLGGVHLGDQARARVDAFPDDSFTGAVSFLSARVDAETRTVRARIDVTNEGGKLRPGMFVEVELVDPHNAQGREGRPPSLVVPQAAVVRDGEERFVFVPAEAEPEGGESSQGGPHRRFEKRTVRLGREAGGDVEILEGLVPGDVVVVEGAFLLKSALSEDALGGGHSH